MSGHVPIDRLNDYAEGLLDGAARAAVEQHLTDCEDCRVEAAAIAQLIGSIASLPRSIEPPVDLRPGIWRAIDAHAANAVIPLRQKPIDALRWPLAAAAVLLIAVTAALTFLLSHRPAGESLAVGEAIGGYVKSAAVTYESAIADLEAVVAAQREQLAPSTLRVLEENLRIIDQALAESRSALDADPGNANVSRLLLAGYEKKLDLLRGATETRTGI